ncbi:hypothetical protein BU24DRAFT_494834 [Aaosphaeria arxii CBS 175.79]|uniref:Beta-apo-4'-carotenal oxygenase n=1 Tax=Aaosphaeria arxii CBS 175.79 TaxID=1450172 RepID=A0A6A5XI49_9PLEO|nr:uncharacterized protein BU24DRAFT_494834 [Aaosphaeria arxii CBS 175.79]KAF2012918.1 hypothetical protein BU24DRAFT_494834 [Aaosphaeria arxii CBS 175.79]
MSNQSNLDNFNVTYKTLRQTFSSGRTKDLKWRTWQLKQLFWLLDENESAFIDSLHEDLHRHAFESLMADINEAKTHLFYALENLQKWAAGSAPPDAGFVYGTLGKAWIRKEPRGLALIIGAWNYPISTLITVAIAAISAGNAVIMKPSEMASATEQLLATLVPKYLDNTAIAVLCARPEDMAHILEYQFDFIFYTGSTRVGRIIASAAAKHVTPVALELGGQAPAIVTKNANLDLAAKRLVNAKLVNLGQICICVNHVFADPEIYDEFNARLVHWANVLLESGTDTLARIINERHFDRVQSLLLKTEGKISFTGTHDRRKKLIYPTIVTGVKVTDSLLSEEIFGPVLPVISASLESALATINSMPHPLALYIFSQDKQEIDRILDSTQSGGVTINDVAVHADVPSAPFGGVGNSGYGNFHGKWGFDTFSHDRAVQSQQTAQAVQPYTYALSMSRANSKSCSIPQPRGIPFLGNIAEFKSEDSLQDYDRLFDTHGDIFRLKFPGMGTCVFIGTQQLANEVFDESRFKKSIQADLGEIRHVVNDGLFTADHTEENWGLAHRILRPAFAPNAIQSTFDEMYDVLSQMALKWARHGPENPIHSTDDFTRLTLDTLALCTMGYRFNSFYSEEVHPFVKSMGDALVEAGKRTARPRLATTLFLSAARKFAKDISIMRVTSEELIKSRRAEKSVEGRKDLLTAMMDGIDPKTGATLSDAAIVNNLITFLIAGHETTSGTLSFAFYSMLKNPDTYQKAQQEVDKIMGKERVTIDKLSDLKYIPALLRETLRQCSPIPAVLVEPFEDTTLQGKYAIKKGEPVVVSFSRTHLDPIVYGHDACQFKPERMLDENFDRLVKEFPNCWKPFGNGMRACIGRPFAWQEMLLAMSVLLQNFDFHQLDPGYSLKLSETLTIKPKDFMIRASLRHGMSAMDLELQLSGRFKDTRNTKPKMQTLPNSGNKYPGAKPINIYFGSNSGTCEALAHRLASNASAHGFAASVVDQLNSAKEGLRSEKPIIILTASYEGQAPDNAIDFVHWLENTSDTFEDGVFYAVFGVGSSEWRQTFHRIPKVVDQLLEKKGAKRLVPLGLTDVAKNNHFQDFELWEDQVLWPALREHYAIPDSDTSIDGHGMDVSISAPRCSILRQNLCEATVHAARVLTNSEAPLKKHIEIRLPDTHSFEAGDYLAVLPINPNSTVSRVFRRFKLVRDATILIQGNPATLLPMQGPTSASDIFSSYVELSTPATRKDILRIAMYVEDTATKAHLQSLASDAIVRLEEGNSLGPSVLDILEQFPLVQMPIGVFLNMLPPIRTRQYSISSSPLSDPHVASLTYSVLNKSSPGGEGKHVGVASMYLASLQPDDRLHVSIRHPNHAFHPPKDPSLTPIICIAAGAGIAPFRGFIQQRAIQSTSLQNLAPALLIYGCHNLGDDLYREEFDHWEATGAVQIKRAYSRQQDETDGCKHVQDRMREQRQLVKEMWEAGAKIYVCGSRGVKDSVESALVEILHDVWSDEQTTAVHFLEAARGERFLVDVFD